MLTVSTLIHNYLGIEDVCLSIPCVLGRTGVVRQLKVGLSQTEAADLRRSAEKLKDVQDALPD